VTVIPSNGELGLADVNVKALLLLMDMAEGCNPLKGIPPNTVQLEESCGWILNKLAPWSAATKKVPLVSDVVKNFIII
jgi:hypothetical protein